MFDLVVVYQKKNIYIQYIYIYIYRSLKVALDKKLVRLFSRHVEAPINSAY